jgi:PAS domain S-box-containing protein
MHWERKNRIILSVFVLVVLGSILNLQNDSFAQPARTSNHLDLAFTHLTIEDGLSQGMVNAIYQDRQGFMWFGTKAGLNRYDGYRFTIFRNDPFDSTSLSNNYITTIFEDRHGRLWVGTGDGLNCFDPATEQFRRFLHDPDDPHSLSDHNISAVCEAPAPVNTAPSITVLWIGTLNGGLNKLVLRENDAALWVLPPAMRMRSSKSKKQADHYFVRYQHDPAAPKSLSSNRVWDLLVDHFGVLWIGTDRGLCRLDPPHSLSTDDDQGANFSRYVHNAKEASSLLDNECSSLYETRDRSIWVGTGKGLARMTPAAGSSGVFENHHYSVELLLLQNPNPVFEICEDRRGALWLATYLGLLVFDIKKQTYQWVRHDSGDPASLSYDGVHAVFRDRSDGIWIGTAGFGLNRWDPQLKQFQAYTSKTLALHSDTDLSIYALLEDRRGLMWIFANHDWYQFNRKTGSFARRPLNFAPKEVNALYEDQAGFLWITNNAGVSRYDPRSGRIKTIFPQPDEPKFKLHAIYEDNNGDMWFGSVSALPYNAETSPPRRHALYCWNRKTEKVTEYPIPVLETLKGGWLEIVRIIQGQSGIFWLATNCGLLRFHPQSGALKIFQNEPGNRGSLTNNDVKTLMADPLQPERFLWLGTDGGGLNRFDLVTESFSHYLEEQGLPNNVVYGLLSDNAGNLWMSTNKGLSKAVVAADTREIVKFRNYDVGDGLQSNEFNTNAYFKNARGEMSFGGVKGFNVFHPDSIKEHSSIPPVVFTDFQIRYQSVKPGQPGSPLRKTINTTETITLSPKDNVMAIEFAALDYAALGKNLYAYKLENFDESWSQPSRRRRATYTNLKPGQYVFRVRASNNDGVWNETGARLAIEIKPYFYQTGWFAALGALALGLTIYGGIRWRLRYLEVRQRELEKLITERTLQLRDSEARLRQLNERLEQRVFERTVALRDSEERYRVLYEYNPNMYFTVDAKGMVLSVNQFGVEHLGYTKDELVNQSVLKIFPEEDKRLVQQQLMACLQHPHQLHTLELRKIRKDGSILWVNESARAIKDRERDWVVLLVCEDITARKQAETAIRESENRYHVLFEEAPTPLWEIDMSEVKSLLAQWQEKGVDILRTFFDGHPEAVEQCLAQVKTLDVNQAAWQLYHANSKEQLILNARQIWNVESMSAFKEQLIAIAAGKTDNKFETNTQTLSGEKIDIWVHWHVMPGYELSLSRIFIATIDITERKGTLNALQVSRERLRALSAHLQSLREQERLAIARDLHDELGQALTALKMDLSMLERKAKTAHGKLDAPMLLGEVGSMQQRVTATINKVRNLITELRPEILDTLGLLPALEWQLEEFQERTNLACEFHSDVEELHLAKEHAVAIFRIFQESLTNIARHANASKVRAKIEERDHALRIEIADNGKGISAEDLNIPGKFGLLGMRERALVFGGEVIITGAPGRGTTVKVKVPIPV